MSGMWRQNNNTPPERPQLDLTKHPRSAELDQCLAGNAPRTIYPPVPPARELGVPDLGACPGWVVNPPRQMIRRCGPGAQLTHVRRKREQLDPLHEMLGAEYFDEPEPEPELESVPAVATAAETVGIGELAAMLEGKADAIRNWIEKGIIPDAPLRSARRAGHPPRGWASPPPQQSASGPPRRPTRSSPPPVVSASCPNRAGRYPRPTSLSMRGRPGQRSRCGAIEKRKPSRISG